MPTRTQYEQFGSAKSYKIENVRNSGPNGGRFKFSENFAESLDKKFDSLFTLGVLMNHHSGGNNTVNSWSWLGFSKLARRIEKLYLLTAWLAIDEPSSEDAAYTQVKIAATTHDVGEDRMPDLDTQGIFCFGWSRNFYDAVAVADQNKLEVWDGAALLDMNDYLYGAVHNRSVAWNMQAPMVYDYSAHPMGITKPITFYHQSQGNIAAHTQWAMMKLLFGVKFFRGKRWWNL